jgi:hypothetical protein
VRDTGSGRRPSWGDLTDTGINQRITPDTGAGGRGDWRDTTDSGGDWRETTDTGSGPRPDWRVSDPRAERRNRRRPTDSGSGQWRDLTGAAEPAGTGEPRYDPIADDRHDLDPEARHSLPMYPEPDPSWSQSSGRHARLTTGDLAGRLPRREPDAGPTRGPRGGGPTSGAGAGSDTGAHRQVEPEARGPHRSGAAREIGGQRRRLDSDDRRGDDGPDLTPIDRTGWTPTSGADDPDAVNSSEAGDGKRPGGGLRPRTSAVPSDGPGSSEGTAPRDDSGGRRPFGTAGESVTGRPRRATWTAPETGHPHGTAGTSPETDRTRGAASTAPDTRRPRRLPTLPAERYAR